jgi:hypothetical protein
VPVLWTTAAPGVFDHQAIRISPLRGAGACAGNAHSAGRKHLQRYLHEFEFRFDRRASHARTHLFRRLLEGVVLNGHTACSALCG